MRGFCVEGLGGVKASEHIGVALKVSGWKYGPLGPLGGSGDTVHIKAHTRGTWFEPQRTWG